MDRATEDRDAYYKMVEQFDEKFWRRLGGYPSLSNSSCLDLGCGVGSLSVDLARNGAAKVLGIDPDKDRIDYALSQRDKLVPQLRDSIRFEACGLSSLVNRETFDIIVSRDSFEHIHGLENVISQIQHVLKPGGRLFLGFGPLYNSPLGDHRLIGFGIPWLHLLLDKLGLAARFCRLKYALMEKELNKLSFKEICSLLQNSELEIEYFEVNAGDSFPLKFCRIARKASCIEEYFSVNIYAILAKKIDN